MGPVWEGWLGLAIMISLGAALVVKIGWEIYIEASRSPRACRIRRRRRLLEDYDRRKQGGL